MYILKQQFKNTIMENKHKVYNLIILDESGSMQAIKKTIMNGFNEVVQTIKNVALQYTEQEHTVTFVSFNSLGLKKIHETFYWFRFHFQTQKLFFRNKTPSAPTGLADTSFTLIKLRDCQ